jgi:hypothetical protein
MKLERMQFIADHFQELHLEKIDRLELIDRLMWQEYEKETQPYRRVKILETIANAQANVSSYYETSTIALEDNLLYRYVPDEDDLKVGERIRIPPQEIIDTSTEFVEEFLHNKFNFDMGIYSMEDWLETLVPVMTHIQKMVQKVAQERYMLAQKRARRECMMSYDNPDKLQ